ncbi:MAG: IclR family transcriptional regulator [Acidimicrobiales bacterium]
MPTPPPIAVPASGARPDAGLQVVRRAAVVLRTVGEQGGGLRLAELTDRVQLPKTTVHRVVNALADEGLLRLDPHGRIWLGPLVATLSRTATADLAAQVRPAVVGLHRRLDETVDVSVLEGAGARFIDQVQSTRPLRAVSAVGATFPLHATANGKALLASLAPAEADALLAGALEALTPATIVDRAALQAELEVVRLDGIAFDREEHSPGICAVGAVATPAGGGPVVAISVPVPAERFARSEGEVVAALREAVAEAARLLAPAT